MTVEERDNDKDKRYQRFLELFLADGAKLTESKGASMVRVDGMVDLQKFYECHVRNRKEFGYKILSEVFQICPKDFDIEKVMKVIEGLVKNQ